MSITLKNGDELEKPRESLLNKEKRLPIVEESELYMESKLKIIQEIKPQLKAYKPKPLFPQKLWSAEQNRFQKKFMSMLKKLHINTPFLYALN